MKPAALISSANVLVAPGTSKDVIMPKSGDGTLWALTVAAPGPLPIALEATTTNPPRMHAIDLDVMARISFRLVHPCGESKLAQCAGDSVLRSMHRRSNPPQILVSAQVQ